MSVPQPGRVSLRATLRRRGVRLLGGAAASAVFVRALGVLSQAIAATAFGAGQELDALLVAMIVPNLVAVPYAAGLELGYGPAYARLHENESDRLEELRGALYGSALRSGLLAVAAMLVLAPVLVRISAPGASDAVHDLSLDLAWLLYPTVIPSLFTAASSSVLFARNRVHLPVLAQSFRPVAIILAVVLTDTIHAVAAAVLVGALVEAGVLAWRVNCSEGPSRLALRPSPLLRAWRSDARTLTATTFVTQVAPAVDLAVAASTGTGRLVIYSLASRFYDVGKAAFVQPSARLAQNRLSVAAGSPTKWAAQLRFETHRLLVAGAVGAAMVALVGPALLYTVFLRGEFTSENARSASGVVLVLGAALVPWALSSVLQRALAVLRLRKRYAVAAGAYLAMNVLLDVILAHWFGLVGIALATVASLVALSVVLVFAVRSPAGPVPALEHEERP